MHPGQKVRKRTCSRSNSLIPRACIDLLTHHENGLVYIFLARMHTKQKNQNQKKTAIFKLFLPLLLFLSIMETVHNARRDMHADMSADPLQLILPPVWAFVVLAVSAIVGKLAIRMFVHDRDEAVRRILFVALLLGNANNLPLLLIRRYVRVQSLMYKLVMDSCVGGLSLMT